MRSLALQLIALALAVASVHGLAQDADVSALLQTARQMQAKGDTDGAARQYEAAARACEDPATRAAIYFELGCMFASRRPGAGPPRTDDAVDALRKAAESPARDMQTRALNQLITVLMSAERFPEAIAAAEDLARRAADDPMMVAHAQRTIARCYQEQEQFDEAAETLQQLLASRPDLPGRSAVVSELADIYTEGGDLPGAARALEDELEREPANTSLARRLINLYQREHRIREARAVCERGLKAAPRDAGLALLLYQLHKAGGTVEQYVEQLVGEARGGDEIIIRRLAEVYFREGRKLEAIEQFERLARVKPDDIAVHQRLGWLYRETGDLQAAREQYEAVARIDPNNLGVYSALGDVYARLGDKSAALDAWKKSARYSPNDVGSIQRLGRLLLTQSLYDEARRIYEEGRARLGDDALFAVDMGAVLEAQLDVEGAIREYLRAVVADSSAEHVVSRSTDRALQVAEKDDRLPALIAEAKRLRAEHPDNVALARLLLRAYLSAGEVAQAAGLLDELAERGTAIAPVSGDILELGEQLLEAGETAKAAGVFRRLHSGMTDPLSESRAGIGAARALGAGGDWTGAARELEALVARQGRDAVSLDVLFELADIYLRRLHEVAKAREVYEAIRGEVQDPGMKHDAEAGLADCLFASGEYEQASEAYAALRRPRWLNLQMPPRPPLATSDVPMDARFFAGMERSERGQYMVAECAFRQGDLSEAARLFKDFAERHPDSEYTNDALARIGLLERDMRQDPEGASRYIEALNRADRGEVQAAADALQELADALPEGPLSDDALMAAARLLADAGDAAGAAAKCRALAERHPDSLLRPGALLLSAELLSGPLGQPERALEVYAAIASEYADAPAGGRATIEADDLRRALARSRPQ